MLRVGFGSPSGASFVEVRGGVLKGNKTIDYSGLSLLEVTDFSIENIIFGGFGGMARKSAAGFGLNKCKRGRIVNITSRDR